MSTSVSLVLHEKTLFVERLGRIVFFNLYKKMNISAALMKRFSVWLGLGLCLLTSSGDRCYEMLVLTHLAYR